MQRRALSRALLTTATATHPVARPVGAFFRRRRRVPVTLTAAITAVGSYLVLMAPFVGAQTALT
jgi:hypothetical protein